MGEDEFLKPFMKESVFLQASSLDPSYVPNKLLCRDDIINDLIFNFRRILDELEQPSINCLILGKNGVGKTASARFFAKNFRNVALEKKKTLFIEYYNCIHFRKKSAIIREILAKHIHGSGRGFGDEEALKLILKQLRRHDAYMLLVIDEVQLLSPSDIFSLLGISETFGHQNVKLSIILISTTKDWMHVETTYILSKINSKFILKPYSFDDIEEILNFRVKLAFKKKVIDDDLLKIISQIVFNDQSLTNGIRLLRQCGLMADKEGLDHINMDIVKTVSHEMYPTLRIQIIEQLKDHELFTLYGIAKTLINTDKPFTLVDEAFEEYNIICEVYNVESHTIKTFRKYLQILSKMRIISSETVRIEEAERGRHLEISLIDITPDKLDGLLVNILDRKFS